MALKKTDAIHEYPAIATEDRAALVARLRLAADEVESGHAWVNHVSYERNGSVNFNVQPVSFRFAAPSKFSVKF